MGADQLGLGIVLLQPEIFPGRVNADPGAGDDFGYTACLLAYFDAIGGDGADHVRRNKAPVPLCEAQWGGR